VIHLILIVCLLKILNRNSEEISGLRLNDLGGGTEGIVAANGRPLIALYAQAEDMIQIVALILRNHCLILNITCPLDDRYPIHSLGIQGILAGA
jgi:hypothetical protein